MDRILNKFKAPDLAILMVESMHGFDGGHISKKIIYRNYPSHKCLGIFFLYLFLISALCQPKLSANPSTGFRCSLPPLVLSMNSIRSGRVWAVAGRPVHEHTTAAARPRAHWRHLWSYGRVRTAWSSAAARASMAVMV